MRSLTRTRVYPANDSPYYRLGMWCCASFMLFNALLAFGLRYLLVWENGELDQKYGSVARISGDGKVADGVPAGVADENDGPWFRFVL
jgi:hypothetical protein